MTSVRFRRLPHAANLPAPTRHSDGAAGFDLMAALPEPLTLAPGARALVPTGYVFEIPYGFEGQVRPRSGLALKHGVTVLNAPGTVDADYRGEVAVVLINHGEAPFLVEPGARIAQFVVCATAAIELVEADELSGTSRGERGFGSTGMIGHAEQGERI